MNYPIVKPSELEDSVMWDKLSADQDKADNAIHRCLMDIVPEERIEDVTMWDIKIISEIREFIRDAVYKHYDIKIPYAEFVDNEGGKL